MPFDWLGCMCRFAREVTDVAYDASRRWLFMAQDSGVLQASSFSASCTNPSFRFAWLIVAIAWRLAFTVCAQIFNPSPDWDYATKLHALQRESVALVGGTRAELTHLDRSGCCVLPLQCTIRSSRRSSSARALTTSLASRRTVSCLACLPKLFAPHLTTVFAGAVSSLHVDTQTVTNRLVHKKSRVAAVA